MVAHAVSAVMQSFLSLPVVLFTTHLETVHDTGMIGVEPVTMNVMGFFPAHRQEPSGAVHAAITSCAWVRVSGEAGVKV